MMLIYLFVLGRVLFGGYFIKSGLNHFKNLKGLSSYAQSKGVPMPREGVLLTGAMMVLGGLGILLGIYIEISVTLLIIFLLSTLAKMHQYWNVADPQARMGEHINFYKNLAMIGALLMILMIPMPWVMSLR
jgi:uncharacterized membrane protein YphA (DoxX/SURF4 family)